MKGWCDMKKSIEKIIEKLEEYRDENLVEHDSEMANHCKQDCNDVSDCMLCVWNKAIEIVKSESEKCKDGHFGCNTNGEHEKCNGCGLTDCKSRNKIWFGAGDDDTDTNVGNNSWIPCSEPPKTSDYILLSFSNFSVPMVGRYEENEDGGAYYIGDEDKSCVSQDIFVNAWQPLPEQYNPKGE